MADKQQQETDEAIIDHLDRTNPDAEVRERYWRKQYDQLLERMKHDNKERKRMGFITRLLCYTIYISNTIYMVARLCEYNPEIGWDSAQRILWCIVLILNSAFGVFVLMSRWVTKIEKQRMDYHWKSTQTILELQGKLEVAEHNLEVLKAEKSTENGKSTPVKAKKSTKSAK